MEKDRREKKKNRNFVPKPVKEHDRKIIESTQLRIKRKQAPLQITESDSSKKQKQLEITQQHFLSESLIRARICYCCKKKYNKVHFFYDQMCAWCATLNYRKREQSADLTGRLALVTGGRVKIGFQCTLKLLRAGAFVIVTTRFPKDAALRFSREEDFSEWKERIHIYGIDFRDVVTVEKFVEYLSKTYDHLNILINNAAQTIRRPPSFYLHLMEVEAAPLDSLPNGKALMPLLTNHESQWSVLSRPTFLPSLRSSSTEPRSITSGKEISISPSAVLPLVPMTIEDQSHNLQTFPPNCYDIDHQQVDLRNANSWSSTMETVSTVELIEVQTVNSTVPFIFISKLKPLLLRSKKNDRYIINVSSMEGKFYQPHKNDRHPHTNMAKAALNMMTLTIAPSFGKDGIYVNSVDTGWVTDEHPQEKMKKQGFEPPLDDYDGMARVLDPVFRGVNSREYDQGCFFKDYQISKW